MGIQDEMKKFYDVDNLVTVKIELPTFEELRNAEPRGGEGYLGHRYDWHKATTVTVSGTKFPKTATTFNDVGVIKKSYFGSLDKEKPSMRVDFTRFEDHKKAIEKLIGTRRLTLNNCKQDPGYLRQPLTYEILNQAGMSHYRCNFVKVFVNDTDMGLYVNLEPLRKPYLERNFGNDKGNAYEIDFGEDINAKTLDSGHLSHEGFSDYEDKKDVKLLAALIEKEGLAGARKAIDWEYFMRFWAMEILLKHKDGYIIHQNNSFLYNDVKPVADPTIENLNFKLIHSGVDMTLTADPNFYLGDRAVLAKLVVKDEAAKAELMEQVKKYIGTVFSPDNYSARIEPFIQRLEAKMKEAGIEFTDDIIKQIDVAKQAIKAAGSDAPLHLIPKS